MATPLDDKVTALARQLAAASEGQQASVFRMSWWADRVLDRAMEDAAFRTQLFRLVDVFPALHDDAEVHRHLAEHFDDEHAPALVHAGLRLADAIPGIGKRSSAAVTRRNIERMARQFIVGTTDGEVVAALGALWQRGVAFTVDLLGEKTLTSGEADQYADRVGRILDALVEAAPTWPARPHLEHSADGPLPRVNVSLKPTALSPKFAPLTRDEGLEQAKARLRPILRVAAAHGAFVNLDMEHYDVKDLTLQLLREVLDEDGLAGLQIGVAVQAYLRDARDDLADLVAWSSTRPTPITVRLVKGAYWDTEVIQAGAAGWPVPVFERKEQTDASFERCARMLLDHHGEVRAAFGTHNLRSLAYAVCYARDRGVPDDGYEIQMLHGMAEPLQAAVRDAGLRLRVYAPMGELVPGMAYLVRRLLENTANESFLRQRYAEGRALDELLRPPPSEPLPGPAEPARRPASDPGDPADYRVEPVAEWRRAGVRAAQRTALDAVAGTAGRELRPLVGGEEIDTGIEGASIDPGDPDRLVARVRWSRVADVDAAVAVAREAWGTWRARPVRDRVAVLFGAAAWLRSRRPEIAALEVFEAGKPWAEADADVCEAIDFLEYHGREALRLAAGAPVQSPPGEQNRYHYVPRGVAAVISPWNFPLAIPAGQVSAALATGNCVVFKPAEQTPAVAAQLVEALRSAGLPDGALGFLPGYGDVGAALVRHPDVAVVAFTGSSAVGQEILAAAAAVQPGQRHVKRVVAEMGGKNAIVVDADADPDVAVPAIIHSAFGYAGQKCSAASRLILLDRIHDAVLDRLVAAARELRIGHPADMGTEVGPLIDDEAHRKVAAYAALAPSEGTVVLARDDVPRQGHYAGPMIVAGVDPDARLAREEIFGPVLTVHRAASLDEAIALANRVEYGLTAGIISRSPANVRRAAEQLRAGNVYVNRAITGAVVGRQPFGGLGLSGIGSKAGGPDYLIQFCDPRVVTENTIRQGYAPLD